MSAKLPIIYLGTCELPRRIDISIGEVSVAQPPFKPKAMEAKPEAISKLAFCTRGRCICSSTRSRRASADCGTQSLTYFGTFSGGLFVVGMTVEYCVPGRFTQKLSCRQRKKSSPRSESVRARARSSLRARLGAFVCEKGDVGTAGNEAVPSCFGRQVRARVPRHRAESLRALRPKWGLAMTDKKECFSASNCYIFPSLAGFDVRRIST